MSKQRRSGQVHKFTKQVSGTNQLIQVKEVKNKTVLLELGTKIILADRVTYKKK